ncbi:hypothetical protein Rhsp01_60950 [Rhizobium sp. NBRC 114257]|uniref:Uncharacterized protein n=1 Tax=Rhizobium dioscoreae TaxID=2653122 RepID=A0ABQ0ZDP9_9HYPH|nr:hypothetical protein RsS93_61310 [Rhizobium dioscoreae]GLU84919.1 hypothetical protein Rhsp01_60950 [Rhizobium sp. NBRC 114257]
MDASLPAPLPEALRETALYPRIKRILPVHNEFFSVQSLQSIDAAYTASRQNGILSSRPICRIRTK